MPETFTETEQATLDDLLAKQARVQAAEAETKRVADKEAFAPVATLLDNMPLRRIRNNLDAALAAPGLSADARLRLTRFDQIFSFDVEQGLVRERERLDMPIPLPAEPTETPVEEEPVVPDEPAPTE